MTCCCLLLLNRVSLRLEQIIGRRLLARRGLVRKPCPKILIRLPTSTGEDWRGLRAMSGGVVEGARVLLVDTVVVPGARRQIYVLQSGLLVSAHVNVAEAARFNADVVLLVIARTRRFLSSFRLCSKVEAK